MANVLNPNFHDIMDDDASFSTILTEFGLDQNSNDKFTDDFPSLDDLRTSSIETIRGVISNQNKLYRDNADAAQRCYITAVQQNYILALHRWSIFAITDAGAKYDVASVGEFTIDWVRAIVDEYNLEDPEPTSQNTSFSVTVLKFSATNWFEVKSQFHALLATRIGHAGIPLTYLVRNVLSEWIDTEDVEPLQERRIRTKLHSGHIFDRDNRELHRILMLVFHGTTLEDLVKSELTTSNGLNAYNNITANVEGGSYTDELKRKADESVTKAFFNPSRAFTLEQYFAVHTKAHEMMSAAQAPTPEWRKISDFMKNVQCASLQNDYRNIKDTPPYNQNFAAFYNKMNENYRMLIQQGIICPASLNRRRNISQIDVNHNRGGRGCGRGNRGNYNSNFQGRGGRGRGRGRGGRGRGTSGRGGDRQHNNNGVDLSCLPEDFNINNVNDSFSAHVWNAFTWQQQQTIRALRRLTNSNRQLTVNMFEAHRQRNQNHQNHQTQMYSDDGSSITSQRYINNAHFIPPQGSVIIPPPPPPPGPPALPPPPPPHGSNPFAYGASANSQSSQAGSIFGRRG